MIELTALEKVYFSPSGKPIQALKNINLQINAGEIFGVIGKSGAGKSSLIRCVNLLERPSSGIVRVAGQELTQLDERELRSARRNIGMIFQHFNLLSSRTVYDNIALPLELAGYAAAEITATILPLLELTGLTEKKYAYPDQLSGGQKQRVAIARALANKPQVLLCDEATSALDPHTTNAILDLLKNINRQLGLTILLITHEMQVVKQICDRVALLHNGEIVEQDEIIQFFTNPRTELAKTFTHTALRHDLPLHLQQQVCAEPQPNHNPLLRIIFKGSAASEPIISYLIRKLDLEINILQANIEALHQDTIGIMVVEVLDNQSALQTGIDYLKHKGIQVEIIGYVARHAH